MTGRTAEYFAALEATWPAARIWRSGPFTLREGQGGGQRVSAATADGPVTDNDIAEAEKAMRDIGQVPLFMIRDEAPALDKQLEDRRYTISDPTRIYTIPVERLTDVPIPRVTAFTIWEPLAIMNEIWETDGIGPARRAVMDRARLKTAILSRWNDKPGGAAFAAMHDDICMVHAVVVLPHQRRGGLGVWMMRRAAFWAAAQGAERLSVLCTQQNTGATAFYKSMGFEAVGGYHYRRSPD